MKIFEITTSRSHLCLVKLCHSHFHKFFNENENNVFFITLECAFYIYKGSRFSSTESAMLDRHVSTVAQNG